MNALSVVIITFNEEHNIADCIRSAILVSDDVIVVDCGSTDHTAAIAKKEGARIFAVEWKGYGFSKNVGAAQARHEWILSVDADERITKKLATAINSLNFSDRNCIYKFRRKNFIGKRQIRFGTLGFETIQRIYHREYSQWDLSFVHEKLVAKEPIQKTISGSLLHFGLRSPEEHKEKAVLYARLSAEKYFLQGKSTYFLQRGGSALFNSVKSYIFLLGFMDGKQGFFIAKTIACYSWLKYFYLCQLRKDLQLPKVRLIQKQALRVKTIPS